MNDKPKSQTQREDEDSGTGSVGGAIEFHDFISVNNHLREEKLPPDVIKDLQSRHKRKHEALVEKQKKERDYRHDVKEGKVTPEMHKQNKAERNSGFPPHPTLSDKAQFSGIDKQENQIPTNSETQTNDADRNEL